MMKMRRLPVYLLIDTSESMVGPAIEAVQNGLGAMLNALRKNPYALEMGAISIVAFGGKAQKIIPLTEVYAFQPPSLEVRPGTTLGAAIAILDQSISMEVVKTTPDRKGDYKPLIFILTDGQPTDEWRPSFQRFKQNHKNALVYAIGCGDDADFSILRELTENTYAMEQMSADTFAKLFVCISSSISSASAAIGENGKQTDRFNLEKDAEGMVKKVENAEKNKFRKKRQVFIAAICQKTSKPYLIRYRLGDDGKYHYANVHKLEKKFSKEETGAMDSISSNDIIGMAICPHCGNTVQGYCSCETMICLDATKSVRRNGSEIFPYRCPACGQKGCMAYGVCDIKQSEG